MPAKSNSKFKCPNGHGLPFSTAAGECTPVHCALAEVVRSKVQQMAQKARVEMGDNPDENSSEAMKSEAKAVQRAMAREIARLTAMGVPEGLTGTEAERWVDKKQTELSVLAVAEAEYRLRWGDDDERWEAAKFIQDATGHGKKEAQKAAMTNVIVIQGNLELPFRKTKELPKGEVVDAEVTVAKV